jgi:hypothetical protein
VRWKGNYGCARRCRTHRLNHWSKIGERSEGRQRSANLPRGHATALSEFSCGRIPGSFETRLYSDGLPVIKGRHQNHHIASA